MELGGARRAVVLDPRGPQALLVVIAGRIGSITVSNIGDQGVETLYGVIYPPQVTLVGFGEILERPWAEGGLPGVRATVHATLSPDHRASCGHQGGLFLAAIDRRVQRPEAL